jgi:hypothetical protein
MSDDSQLANISYKLRFATPLDFINSLQKLINHTFLQSKIPLSIEFILEDERGQKIKSDITDWIKGRSLYTISTNNPKKVIAKLVVFNLNNKYWFRYEVCDQKLRPYSKTKIVTNSLRDIFSQYSVMDLSNATNFLQINKKLKTDNLGQYKIYPKDLAYLIGFTGALFVFFNQYLLVPSFMFLTFVFITHSLHKAYVELNK